MLSVFKQSSHQLIVTIHSALKKHPNRLGGSNEAFMIINEAYEILTSKETKVDYDAEYRARPPPPPPEPSQADPTPPSPSRPPRPEPSRPQADPTQPSQQRGPQVSGDGPYLEASAHQDIGVSITQSPAPFPSCERTSDFLPRANLPASDQRRGEHSAEPAGPS